MGYTDRQQREIEYHKGHAALHADCKFTPVEMTVVTANDRKWWNATWAVFSILRDLDLNDKQALIPGCGFGDDVARLVKFGAKVSAFDISPEVIQVAKARAATFGYEADFAVMPAEALVYPDSSFDLILCRNILHHVEIPEALREFKRVLKPGGYLIGQEMYTYGVIERIRRGSGFINRTLYPRMVNFIYGGRPPYITEDERKIDHHELKLLTELGCQVSYYDFLIGRILPARFVMAAKIDRALLFLLGPLGRLLAGRIVFSGRV